MISIKIIESTPPAGGAPHMDSTTKCTLQTVSATLINNGTIIIYNPMGFAGPLVAPNANPVDGNYTQVYQVSFYTTPAAPASSLYRFSGTGNPQQLIIPRVKPVNPANAGAALNPPTTSIPHQIQTTGVTMVNGSLTLTPLYYFMTFTAYQASPSVCRFAIPSPPPSGVLQEPACSTILQNCGVNDDIIGTAERILNVQFADDKTNAYYVWRQVTTPDCDTDPNTTQDLFIQMM